METKYMPSVAFEPAIPTIKRLQPHDLDRKATEIGRQQLRPAQYSYCASTRHHKVAGLYRELLEAQQWSAGDWFHFMHYMCIAKGTLTRMPR
jgi:hypothetical protein